MHILRLFSLWSGELGALVAKRIDGVWNVRSLGAPHMGERSEAELLQSFVDWIERRAGEMLKLLAERGERAGRGAPCERRRMSFVNSCYCCVISCYYGPPALAGE
jgi:hypothetical protein